MSNLTPEGLRAVTDIAQRHGVSADAALALIGALVAGGGRQAQFNHPDLGGMGQWSQGGMIMVGDMFNHGLKFRVDALCNDLSALIQNQPAVLASSPQSQAQSQGSGFSLFAPGPGSAGSWWPGDLGQPGSAGAQNDMRYAFFPGARRLAIQHDGLVSVYDTGDHRLSGFSQQQGGDRSLTFTSQMGLVRVADLPLVSPAFDAAHDAPAATSPAQNSPPAPAAAPPPPAAAAPPPPEAIRAAPSAYAPPAPSRAAPAAPQSMEDILKTIERLGELREKGVLTDEEFSAKKAELLGRL